MSAPCLLLLLVCFSLAAQKVKTVLFSRAINAASSSTSLLPLWPLCVFYAQKMWIFRPQNCHLAPIALKNRHLSWLHPLTSLDRCRKGWHICGFSCLREAGCELLNETWPFFHHNAAKYVKNNDGDRTMLKVRSHCSLSNILPLFLFFPFTVHFLEIVSWFWK